MRECLKCKTQKREDEFPVAGKGVLNECKSCRSKRQSAAAKRRKAADPEAFRAKLLNWEKIRSAARPRIRCAGCNTEVADRAKGGKKFCSASCFGKWNMRRRGPTWRGQTHPSWLGGPAVTGGRPIIELKAWRKAVFERDNYTCQDCGQIGGDLQADHIKPYALYPELRWSVSNGKTLCAPCHRKTPTYGGRTAAIKRARLREHFPAAFV